MIGKVELDVACDAESLLNKKRYNRPEVKVFGEIKRLTQGNTGSCNDVGGGGKHSRNANGTC
jgi:hypothetical protein